MIGKIGLIGVFMAILFLPLAAYGQDLSRSEEINTANVANNTFVLIGEEDTGVPGYVHQRYAFVSHACPAGFQIIDYYGAPIDRNDASLQIRERNMCSDLSFDSAEGD
jgi:hypothetical protein